MEDKKTKVKFIGGPFAWAGHKYVDVTYLASTIVIPCFSSDTPGFANRAKYSVVTTPLDDMPTYVFTGWEPYAYTSTEKESE